MEGTSTAASPSLSRLIASSFIEVQQEATARQAIASTWPHLRYAISPGGPAPGPHTSQTLVGHAAQLAAAGIDFFLLREPALAAGELAALARNILSALAGTGTRLFIHSRPDIAIAAGAHGVHLPSALNALTPEQVRAVFTAANCPHPTISLSCHTPEDLRRAQLLHPDLILFGPVFGKIVGGSVITPPIGLEALADACRHVAPIRVLALGGVTEANAPACLNAGAAGIAGIRLFTPQ